MPVNSNMELPSVRNGETGAESFTNNPIVRLQSGNDGATQSERKAVGSGMRPQASHRHYPLRNRRAIEKLQYFQVAFGQRPLSWEWVSWFLPEKYSVWFSSGDKEYSTFETHPSKVIAWRVFSDVYRLTLMGLMLGALYDQIKNYLLNVHIGSARRWALTLPITLGILSAIVSTFIILPKRMQHAIDDVTRALGAVTVSRGARPPLDSKDINWASMHALTYGFFWLIFGVAAGINMTITNPKAEQGPWVFVVTIGTIPALAGTFFMFALDAAKVKTEIRRLKKSAQNMTLTLHEYQISQEYIEDISISTSIPLMLLTFVAVINGVGYIVSLFTVTAGHLNHTVIKDQSVDLAEDLVWFAYMGKEACLFYTFTYLAMVVNNAADDVCTEVYLWPTTGGNDGAGTMEAGEKDVLDERLYRKLQIIAQATTFAGPKDRKYRASCWRLCAPTAGGITFEVLGVRWTPKLMVALILSLGSAVVGVYVQPTGSVTVQT